MTRIDAHQHFWELGRFDYSWLDAPELAPIRRNFLPADLLPLIQQSGIDQTIFVQTQHNVEENRWVLGLAEQNPFICGVVGWVDLASTKCEEQLLEFKDHPQFVGIRHVTQDEPDDNFILREDVIRGLEILQKHQVPFDLLFYVKHLHHATTLAKRLPELPMVIDHLSKPEIKAGKTAGWADHLRDAAQFPNLFCKLSGMVTEADWQNWRVSDLQTYVDVAVEAFGPERCMFGSDWPVCELAGRYGQVHGALAECLSYLSDDEQAAIWGGTARRFYRLARDPS